MLRAIIFDFNGVIADDETPHFLTFQQALNENGLELTKQEYYGTYLGMDERHCAEALLEKVTGKADPLRLRRILDRKAGLFRERVVRERPPLFPGVVEFVKRAGQRYRLSVASGATREQIEFALKGTPIERDFAVIVSADDCAIGKPDPAVYQMALKLLNAAEPRPPLIKADECLVIEDSIAGIRAGKAAGMRVLAVATTYPAEQLTEADLVVRSLEVLALEQFEEFLSHRQAY